jgi:hypothetical protein
MESHDKGISVDPPLGKIRDVYFKIIGAVKTADGTAM